MQALFPHQEEAFEQLLLMARILFERRWRKLPVTPRFNVLLIGPTGLGKTQIVRRVAAVLSLPLFEASASNWMLLGTHHRGANPTWPSLFRFLIENRRGVIFVDELDKIGGKTEWTVFLRTEIFNLLDRTLPRDIADGERDSEGYLKTVRADSMARRLAHSRLQCGMLIAAAGAFQDFWDQSNTRQLGFGSAVHDSPPFLPDHDALSQSLPRELVNRFRSRLLCLRPLGRPDYMAMLHSTASRLPENLGVEFLRLGHESIASAVQSQLGVRWLEELIFKTLATRGAARSQSLGITAAPHPRPAAYAIEPK
jgi:SpoVK/Ycf46/Vps4 family AAA+-type ATPase